jgi:hypothetical protein
LHYSTLPSLYIISCINPLTSGSSPARGEEYGKNEIQFSSSAMGRGGWKGNNLCPPEEIVIPFVLRQALDERTKSNFNLLRRKEFNPRFPISLFLDWRNSIPNSPFLSSSIGGIQSQIPHFSLPQLEEFNPIFPIFLSLEGRNYNFEFSSLGTGVIQSHTFRFPLP